MYGVDHAVEMKLQISVAIGGGAGKGMMRLILTDSLYFYTHLVSLQFDFLYTRIKCCQQNLTQTTEYAIKKDSDFFSDGKNNHGVFIIFIIA